MRDSVANQSLPTCAFSAYIQRSTRQSWLLENDVMVLDGSLLFLIILIPPETAKDGSESHEAEVILGPNQGSKAKTFHCVAVF